MVLFKLFPWLIVSLIYMGDKEERQERLEYMGCVLPVLLNVGMVLFLICAPIVFTGMDPDDPVGIVACYGFPIALLIWAVAVRIRRAVRRQKRKKEQ